MRSAESTLASAETLSSASNIFFASALINGSLIGPNLLPTPNKCTRTPRRDSACEISNPITPVPTTAIDSGKVSQAKTSSLIRSLSPSAYHGVGIAGLVPAAITILLAITRTPPSTINSLGPTNFALPQSLCSAGQSSTASSTKPTNRSRSALTRAITRAPSTVDELTSIPNFPASPIW